MGGNEYMGYRNKFLIGSMSAAIAASSISPALAAENNSAFADENQFGVYKDFILKAVELDLIKGANKNGNTYFYPNQQLTREHAVLILGRYLGDVDTTGSKQFKDVDQLPKDHELRENALKVRKNGIFSGWKDNLQYKAILTREEMAKILVQAFQLKHVEDSNIKVTDLDKAGKEYQEDITILAENGITVEKVFNPKAKVTRGQFITALIRAVNGGDKKEGNFELTLMHTNDTHAHLDNIAKRITAIKEVRSQSKNTLLLDAGDVFSGTLYFNEYLGQADLEFMNLIGYDVMTFGNHEFDQGTKPLAEFVKNAKFPFVSANADFSKDVNLKDRYHNELATTANDGEIYNSIIKEIDGEKVGIFGLTTAETKDISSPGDVEFKDYIEEAKKAVEQLESQGINKIIALTHIGFDDGGGDNDLTLAKEVEGIDVIVGGHSHTKLAEPVKDITGDEPTIIVQANEYSNFLGTLDVEFDEKGKVIGYAGKLLDLNEKKDDQYVIKDDPEAAEILATKYKPAVDAKKELVVGKTNVELVGGNPAARTMETNLGDFIAEGILEKAKKINPDTMIAFHNGGNVRVSVDAGNITVAKILEILPFGNSLGILNLSGAEIKAALEHSVKDAPKPFGGFLQVAGLKFTYDSSKNAGERVVSIEVKDKNGQFVPLDEKQNYYVATNIFTAKGGDGFSVFEKASAEGRLSEPGFVDWEIFKEYLDSQPNKTIEPKTDGRIIDIAKP